MCRQISLAKKLLHVGKEEKGFIVLIIMSFLTT